MISERRVGAGKQALYEDFAHTGPGTLAGRFMRQFWQPVYVAKDLQPGRAVPIQLMSEQFTLYRGEGGDCHLVGFRCAHRGTQLSTGWVEGDCIRCFYHGWKYDGAGQCVERPAEAGGFANKVSIPSYPVQEYLGLVFAFIGDGAPPPPLRFPHIESREGVIDAGRGVLPYNFFTQVENSVDEVHVVFVHNDSQYSREGLKGVPEVKAEETDYGMVVRDFMPNGAVRVVHLIMPAILYITVYPHEPGADWRDFLLWRVPVTDESFQTFFLLRANVTGDAAKRYLENSDRYVNFTHDPSLAQTGDAVLRGELRIQDIQNRSRIVSLQDYVSQRGQGVIADREHERLGRSDVGVILLRKIWAREMRALAEGEPVKEWRVPETLVATSGV